MKKYIITMLIFLLASCGFHPRGASSSEDAGNYDSIIGTKFYVSSHGFTRFSNELKSKLYAYKADLVYDEKDADYIINIQNVQQKSQLTSVVGGASNNTYQLIYTVTYNVVIPHEKTPAIPDKSLNTQQFWQSNSATQLAQNNEAVRTYNFLQTQLVTNMLAQIAALLPDKAQNSNNSNYDEK